MEVEKEGRKREARVEEARQGRTLGKLVVVTLTIGMTQSLANQGLPHRPGHDFHPEIN